MHCKTTSATMGSMNNKQQINTPGGVWAVQPSMVLELRFTFYDDPNNKNHGVTVGTNDWEIVLMVELLEDSKVYTTRNHRKPENFSLFIKGRVGEGSRCGWDQDTLFNYDGVDEATAIIVKAELERQIAQAAKELRALLPPEISDDEDNKTGEDEE